MAIKVISPSSYGEGKIYGISPSTPSINTDITFTRASTKTRINNEGLVESVPYNLLINSEDINNWSKGAGVVITTENIQDPYGTQYADKVECIGTPYIITRSGLRGNAGKYTLSFFIKKGNFDSNNNFQFGFFGGGTIGFITYNFLTNTTSVISGTVDRHGSILYKDGWVRIYLTVTMNATQASNYTIYAGGTGGAGIGVGSFYYIWGAQLVEGSALQPYIRTTDRLNVPSIDYSLGTTNRPVLLLEPQRTNLALSGSTLPTQNITVTNVPHTFSFYGTGSTTLSGAFSDVLIGTGINNRSQLTFTPTGGTLTLTVSGTVSNAQLEVGSYATSYIPTTNASATRLADSFLSDFLFTNETVTSAGGTWFVDLDNNLPYVRDNSDVGLFLGDTTTGTTNSFAFNTPSGSSRLEIDKYVNGVATPLFNTTTDRVKAAIKWNGSTADVFVNGAKVVSGTTFTGTTLEFMGTTVRDTPKYIRGMWLAPVPLPDSDLLSETSPALFIDSFQNAALAFSFRKLRYSYTGPCIRVRRSSDSTEQDIGFVNDVLDEAALTTFVGASNGHVVTWYNQSINGIHLRQTTAANQPLIVVSGVTQKELGKPVILFGSGTTIALNLATPYTFSANVFSKSTVSKYTGSGSVFLKESIWDNSGTSISSYYTDSFRYYSPGILNQFVNYFTGITPMLKLNNITQTHTFGGSNDDNIQQLINYRRNNEIPSSINNNRDQWVSKILFSPTPSISHLSASNWSYTVAEVVYWDGNLESNMNLIRANTNSYYNLYADGSRQFLLNSFTGAAAAYSVRSLNTAYTGPLIRVRRSSDNAETDIFANRNGDLDINALSNWVNQRKESVINGDFDADTNWTKGTGWSIANGKASSDGSQTTASSLFQSCLTVGQTYNFTMTITDYVSGSVTLRNGTGSGVEYTYISAKSQNGTFTGTSTLVPLSNTNLVISASEDFVGSISFVSAVQITHDGFVTTWYDQSGNGRHALQTTAINQPQIFASGSVILESGRVAINFDGINDNFFRGGNFLNTTTAASTFVVNKFNNASKVSRDVIFGFSDNDGNRFDYLLLRQANDGSLDFYIEGNYNASGYNVTDTNRRIFTTIYTNGDKRHIYDNGVLVSTAGNTSLGLLDDATQFNIGTEINLSAFLDGRIQELVIYPNDQILNVNSINSNINNYYRIY